MCIVSIALSSVAYLAPPCLLTLSHKLHYFWKKLLNMKCVFWFHLQFETEKFLILSRTEEDIIINICRSSCKVHVILADFNRSWIFYKIFEKYSNLIKIRPVGTELFHADVWMNRWMDARKLIVAFRNVVNAPKVGENMVFLASNFPNSVH